MLAINFTLGNGGGIALYLVFTVEGPTPSQPVSMLEGSTSYEGAQLCYIFAQVHL